MSNVLAYKGYFAPVEFDAEQHVLTGMVAGIRDAIVFEGSTAEEVEQCFHDAVDDYLEFCAEKGKEPERAFKGSFNVRTGSEKPAVWFAQYQMMAGKPDKKMAICFP